MLAAAPGNPNVYALTRVYLTQAAVMWFVSWPVQVAAYDPDRLSAWIIPGVLVWLVGFGFESIGDAQLAAFRRDPAKKGTVLDTGLWAWTRHPNYFGDAAVWWGLTLLACRSWWGLATIPSALAMTYFLMNKTGKPLLEKHMSDRPGYADYVERTSGFLPRPPRRRLTNATLRKPRCTGLRSVPPRKAHHASVTPAWCPGGTAGPSRSRTPRARRRCWRTPPSRIRSRDRAARERAG